MGNSKSAPKSVSRSRGRSTVPEYEDEAAAPPSNPNAILTTKLPELLQQTVMHWLEPKEMLKLARTSKQLGNTVNNAAAWKHTSPLRLHTPKLLTTPPPASRLLQHMSFALHWRDSKTSVAEDVARVMAVAKTVENFRELHLLCPESAAAAQDVQPLSEAQVASLFEQKAFQSLQEVSIKAPTSQLLRLICALPGVRTISLSERLKSAAEYAPLLTAPALTNLAARDSHGDRESSVASTACNVPQLHSLLLQWPCLYGSSFRSFCDGAAIPQLRELQLNSWQPAGDVSAKLEAVPAEDLASGLAKMMELRCLTLADCGDVTPVLQAVQAAPSLRMLALRRDVKIGPGDDAVANLLASRALLSSVLSLSPLVRLDLFGHEDPKVEFRNRSKSMPPNAEANWKAINEMVTALATEHPGRIRLLTN